MIENIIKPMPPIVGTKWIFLKTSHDFNFQQDWYLHPEGYVACSSMEVADGILRNEVIPQYHLSVSKQGKYGPTRCDSQEAQTILKDFGLSDALEDNHTNGISRSFWMPVDENQRGRECECVNEEVAIKEDKGDFVWRPLSK